MEESLVDKFYGIVDGYYRESDDFKEVEKALQYFGMPLHQQIQQMQGAVRVQMKERNKYPQSTFLLGLQRTLEAAHGLAFAYFTADLTVTEIINDPL